MQKSVDGNLRSKMSISNRNVSAHKLKCHGVLERQDILILDELGYVPFSRTAAELLFEVISRAYERLSLIVTTNLPFESWVEIFGCERLMGALLDRLTHRVHIIEANGPSYRLRQSKRRLQKPDSQSQGNDRTDTEQSGPDDE
jgi:DNA replication protein DnaC